MRTVFTVRIVSRNEISDFGQSLKNIFGGRLKGYEKMLNKAVGEALQELYIKYPNVQNVRISTSQIVLGAAEIIVYGEIE